MFFCSSLHYTHLLWCGISVTTGDFKVMADGEIYGGFLSRYGKMENLIVFKP